MNDISRYMSADTVGFLVDRRARERLELHEERLAADGRLRVPDIAGARLVARRIDSRLTLERGALAGEVFAVAALDFFYREVLAGRIGGDSDAPMARPLERLDERLGRERVDRALSRRIEAFPPPGLERDGREPEELLADDRIRRAYLGDLICLRLANANPAAANYRELFDDRRLADRDLYEAVSDAALAALEPVDTTGAGGTSVADLLESPVRASPDSLVGQLDAIRHRFGPELPDWFSEGLDGGVGALREELRGLEAAAPGPGPGEAPALESDGEARYSPDREWMPRLVLVAKNVRVWMSQLSEAYGRSVDRLDEIPEAALEELADRGFTGLWLIGIWERSRASERIKRRTGRDEAVASAYAIDRYEVARDLGGREAKRALEERAAAHGLRLAADMVPNHMAIDSEWVIEHPDRFVTLDEPPFPAYSFEGQDLCDDDGVEIRIEDGYYDQSDAAVVFERTDLQSGERRYIYHGNDGTSTPWNDTAQIDYLNEEARRVVADRILEVAREFPAIRFDAAMALARKQIRRLWYPPPGEGGAIPSRADHAMTDEQFRRAMPGEFWREVVDRVAEEAPDTLLLAEAFWKMEGYFVRNLGMHRVYNSAFMKMLSAENNADYRELVADAVAEEPRMLERFVNFLNNPDEETAIEQFGTGDKYFGCCTLMATMPGLPMFGHGQFEGYEEEYAMDFAAPRLEEEPNREVVERHEREIVPLLERREEFAGVDGFRFFDFETGPESVDDDVFAYVTGAAESRVLVVYQNAYAETDGCIRRSIPFEPVEESAGPGGLRRESLVDALGLEVGDMAFVRFRDVRSGREFLRPTGEFVDDGLRLELSAYDCRVLGGFQPVSDEGAEPWNELWRRLGRNGVESLDDRLRRLKLEGLQRSLQGLLEAGERTVGRIGAGRAVDSDSAVRALADEVAERLVALDRGVGDFTGRFVESLEALGEVRRSIREARADVRETFEAIGGAVPESALERLLVAAAVAGDVLSGGGERWGRAPAEDSVYGAFDAAFADRLEAVAPERLEEGRSAVRAVLSVCGAQSSLANAPTGVADRIAEIRAEFGDGAGELFPGLWLRLAAIRAVGRGELGSELGLARAAAVGVRIERG